MDMHCKAELKMKTSTQVRDMSQHGVINGSQASQEASDIRTRMEMHCNSERTLTGGVESGVQAMTHMHGKGDCLTSTLCTDEHASP